MRISIHTSKYWRNDYKRLYLIPTVQIDYDTQMTPEIGLDGYKDLYITFIWLSFGLSILISKELKPLKP